jgi:hypothetical protein
MIVLSPNEIQPITRPTQEAQAGYGVERHPGDQPALDQGEVLEDDRVSDDEEWSNADWEESDPVESVRLTQRTIAQFSRHHYRVSPEQHAERQRRWAAKRAERAREARAHARSDQACRSRPEPTPAPRPRTIRARRSSATTHATADPTPPPEPASAPAATAVGSDPGPVGQHSDAVATLARPPKSSDQSTPGPRKGAANRIACSSQALQLDAVGHLSSAPRRSPRSGPTPLLDQRQRPFVNALADLLLVDLLKYPPKS